MSVTGPDYRGYAESLLNALALHQAEQNSQPIRPSRPPNPPRGVRWTLDGTQLLPLPGYLWVDPNDPNNKQVKLKPGLTLASDENLSAKVQSGIRAKKTTDDRLLGTHLLRDDDWLAPEPGYVWVHPNNEKNLDVKPKGGIGGWADLGLWAAAGLGIIVTGLVVDPSAREEVRQWVRDAVSKRGTT